MFPASLSKCHWHFFMFLTLAMGVASAQKPVETTTPPVAVSTGTLAAEITAAFPQAGSVKKAGKLLEVYDAKKKLIGYALYSKPASDGIRGYMGETPLFIALSTKKTILSVQLLANDDTPTYVKKVLTAGLLDVWNGLNVADATKKKVDTVSGATYTSRGIIQSMQAALKTL